METFVGVSKNKYSTLKLIGKGGEGLIYSIKDDPDNVLKIYAPPKSSKSEDVQNYNDKIKNTEKKLLVMLKNPIKESASVAWPRDVVYRVERGRKEFAGFLMKKVSGKSVDYCYTYDQKSRNSINWNKNIIIAMNICSALEEVHNAGHVCGDFNPKNILIGDNGNVMLIDTDSYHIVDGSKTYRCPVATNEYIPRELGMKLGNGIDYSNVPLPTFTTETDNFAVAVHIFRLLMNGAQPYMWTQINYTEDLEPSLFMNQKESFFPFAEVRSNITIPPGVPPLTILSEELQILFVRTFKDGHSDPSLRPNPSEWIDALDDLRKNLKTCRNKPNHVYYNGLKACPWCEVDSRFDDKLHGKPIGQLPVCTLKYERIDYDSIVRNHSLIKTCEAAANKGSPKAQCVMGRLCSDGIASTQNDANAKYWFEKSANQGDNEAQYRLGMMYLDGIGTNPSKNDAKIWLNKSSAGGNKYATQMLAIIDDLIANTTTQVISKSLFKENDTTKEQYKPYTDHEYQGVQNSSKQNIGTETIATLKHEANNGNTESMYKLGEAYRDGLHGVSPSVVDAVEWFGKAASIGDFKSKVELGKICYDEHTYTDAKRWFNQTAKENDSESIYYLGLMYLYGKGVDTDPKKASDFFSKALNLGYDVPKNILDECCVSVSNADLTVDSSKAVKKPSIFSKLLSGERNDHNSNNGSTDGNDKHVKKPSIFSKLFKKKSK